MWRVRRNGQDACRESRRNGLGLNRGDRRGRIRAATLNAYQQSRVSLPGFTFGRGLARDRVVADGAELT